MMVIEHGSGATRTIYPADRCRWTQHTDADGGYHVEDVFFYPGNAAGAAITTTAGDTLTLGVIGKSGRFTGISNVHTV